MAEDVLGLVLRQRAWLPIFRSYLDNLSAVLINQFFMSLFLWMAPGGIAPKFNKSRLQLVAALQQG